MFGPVLARRNLEAALRDVGSTKPAVRADAVRDLVPHAEEARDRVVRALEGALREDAAAVVRAAAAVALADVKGVEALPTLQVAVEDADAQVRQMAITALGEIADPRASGRLRRALSDERPEVRFQAVIAFPRVCARSAESMEALLKATRDGDPMVCHIALRMLEEAGEASDEGLDPAAMARARALVTSDSPLVKGAAAVMLARGGDDAGHPVLVELAAGALRGADREDEAAAVELCGELRLDAARAGLERRAFGGALGFGRDPLHWHARVALAQMGHERATREIVRDLGSWDRDRRTLAVAAAGRARLAAARAPIDAMKGRPDRADPTAVEDALAAIAKGDEDEPERR